MSASFVLTLDTTAPQITWGSVTGADAGELLQVGYTLDEPALQSAVLRLLDGRTLPMEDAGAWLQVELPSDTPEGAGVVIARTLDDVGNAHTFNYAIALTGVLTAAPTAPLPGVPMPSPPQAPHRHQEQPKLERETKTVVDLSRAVIKTLQGNPRSVRQAPYPARAVVRQTGAVTAALRRRDTHTAATDVEMSVKLAANSGGRGRGTGTVSRRDGAELEAMIALGMI